MRGITANASAVIPLAPPSTREEFRSRTRPAGCSFAANNSKNSGGARQGAAMRYASVDQPVEFAGVLARDLVHDLGREAGELLLDVFRGFRPHAVGVRVVGAPHQGLDADVVDELSADRVE